ncbi:MAG: tetratricopeptide repeat protein, partial [Proteobacteria bacterium]|nr:tetratricopeptide repeat protein [Pseudomonadota bacterium]
INIHVLKKEFKSAHEFCTRQLNIIKDSNTARAVIHNIQAQLFSAQKNLEKAKQFFTKAIGADPQLTEPYNALAKLYLSNKENDKALEQYESLLKINPDNAFAHMMIGTIYDQEKKYEKAAAHYGMALKINPDYAPAANNLAYYLAVHTQDFDKALELARNAKEKFPEDPAIADTLGLVYFQKGLYENAATEFIDALKKLTDNAEIHFHLGRTYAKKGENQLAKKYLSRALELSNDFEGHEEAKQLINELN